jgi:hypothetical protein
MFAVFEYKFSESCVTRSDSIKGLGVLIDFNPNRPHNTEQYFARQLGCWV